MPHVAPHEHCAVPRAAPRDRCAAPHVAPHDQRAAQRAVVHPVSYRVLLEPLVLQWSVLERLVMAVPEPQHLTLLARWSAAKVRQLLRTMSA